MDSVMWILSMMIFVIIGAHLFKRVWDRTSDYYKKYFIDTFNIFRDAKNNYIDTRKKIDNQIRAARPKSY